MSGPRWTVKGLGLEPLDSVRIPQIVLPLLVPVWHQPLPGCVALNLVGQPALMLSKNQENDLHCSRFSPGLSSFSVKTQLNSFSKWGILH